MDAMFKGKLQKENRNRYDTMLLMVVVQVTERILPE